MKKLFSVIAVFLITISIVTAQETPYQKVMKKEIATLISTDSLNQLQSSANAFARIAELNTKEWQPLYYQGLAYTFIGLDKSLSLDLKDAALAKAEELINKADVLSPNNAEIVTVQGFILMAKVSADPGSRGQSLSGQVMGTFGKALTMDSKNPRALILMSQMEYGLSKFFGNGTEKACGLAKESLAVFNSQNEDALEVALQPTWGKPLAENMVKGCK
ncbi:hypothetical protein [Dyadobacter psychrotolerans]|uniref:Tetratricopeptide repeat protein n=1 Tax=Dyadobacter psychrotolerans TaxID=2541721 RepID=A0A4R5DRB2_9BACT|nr:hypothetical protein [Dyadobacter psychrotolerans]TDE16849.1 hypothetical protein E0F88_11570 [Dyadobacter psychrotolerans]